MAESILGTGILREQRMSKIIQKYCPRCNEVKPIEMFRKYSKSKSGYRYWCNSCESLCSMEYYEKNRAKIKTFRRNHMIQTQTTKRGGRRNRFFIMGVIKRTYPENSLCEICGKISKKLGYHHWDDSNPSQGIWVCTSCHAGCNFWEKSNFYARYIELKNRIKKYYRPNICDVPLGIGNDDTRIRTMRAIRRQYSCSPYWEAEA